MKQKKRLKRGGRIRNLRASEGVEHGRFTSGQEERRAWRERMQEYWRWLQLPKKRVTLNLDADVLARLRQMGRGYQWEINRALRKVMERAKRKARRQLSKEARARRSGWTA